VIGLNGPVVFAKAGGREVAALPNSTMHLTRVTALLGGPLVELQGGSVGVGTMKTSGLVSTTVTADHCLFASVPGAGKPMVEVDGVEFDRTERNGVLKWTASEPNRFFNFDPSAPVVIVKPDPTSTQNWNWNEWIQFAKETGTPVGKVWFNDGPDDLNELNVLSPAKVEVKSVELPDIKDPKPADAGGADPERVANPPEISPE
jgi:hypothetical protein